MCLAHHRLRVDLAHVSAAVRRPDLFESEGPGTVSVADTDAVVLGDDVSSYCEDCLRVYSEPRHLVEQIS